MLVNVCTLTERTMIHVSLRKAFFTSKRRTKIGNDYKIRLNNYQVPRIMNLYDTLYSLYSPKAEGDRAGCVKMPEIWCSHERQRAQLAHLGSDISWYWLYICLCNRCQTDVAIGLDLSCKTRPRH